MSLIAILVALIIICLLYWGVMRIMAAFGVGDPIATVVQVVFIILIVLWLIGAFYGGTSLRLT